MVEALATPRTASGLDIVATKRELLDRLRREHVEQTWREEASCADPDIPPAWFVPHRESEEKWPIRQARLVCSFCPVRAPCLEQGLRLDQPGIWGGLTQLERRRFMHITSRASRLLNALAFAKRQATKGPWRIVRSEEYPQVKTAFVAGPGRGHVREAPVAWAGVA